MKDEIINKLRLLCQKFGFRFKIAYNQINQESRFNTDAVSPAGAKGLCQFMPNTWRYVYDEMLGLDLFTEYLCENPKNNPFDWNTSLACYMYHMNVQIPKQLKSKGFEDSIENRLRAYNAGAGNVLKSHNFDETNNYVEVILKGVNNFVWLGVLTGGILYSLTRKKGK